MAAKGGHSKSAARGDKGGDHPVGLATRAGWAHRPALQVNDSLRKLLNTFLNSLVALHAAQRPLQAIQLPLQSVHRTLRRRLKRRDAALNAPDPLLWFGEPTTVPIKAAPPTLPLTGVPGAMYLSEITRTVTQP